MPAYKKMGGQKMNTMSEPHVLLPPIFVEDLTFLYRKKMNSLVLINA